MVTLLAQSYFNFIRVCILIVTNCMLIRESNLLLGCSGYSHLFRFICHVLATSIYFEVTKPGASLNLEFNLFYINTNASKFDSCEPDTH